MKKICHKVRSFVRDEGSFCAIEQWGPVVIRGVNAAARVGLAGYKAERLFAMAGHALVEGGKQYIEREYGTKEDLRKNAISLGKHVGLATACYAALC